MSFLDPTELTVHDLCTQALKEAGALGIGQRALSEDVNDAMWRLQNLLTSWQCKEYLIYGDRQIIIAATGQTTPYSVGPSGGPVAPQISTGTYKVSVRPNRIEKAFFQQLVTSPNGPVQYDLKLVSTWNDYTKLAIPGLTTFSLIAFYDPAWDSALGQGLGGLYLWPWPSNAIYNIGIVVRQTLPTAFLNINGIPNSSVVINMPFEYFDPILTNLALALRPKYGLGSYPGDTVPSRAKAGLHMLRGSNTRITQLDMPAGISRYGLYNIYSDQNY